MKKLIVIAIAHLTILAASAQPFKLTKLYVNAGVGSSTSLAVNTVFNNKWKFGAGTMKYMQAVKKPSDYTPIVHDGVGYNVEDVIIAIFSLFLAPIEEKKYKYTLELPEFEQKFHYLTAGRMVPLSRSFNFTIEAGLGMVKGTKMEFQKTSFDNKLHNEYYDFSRNYNITKTNATGIGGLMKAGLQWDFSEVLGLGLEGFYNINGAGIGSKGGVNFSIVCGWLNKTSKEKKNS